MKIPFHRNSKGLPPLIGRYLASNVGTNDQSKMVSSRLTVTTRSSQPLQADHTRCWQPTKNTTVTGSPHSLQRDYNRDRELTFVEGLTKSILPTILGYFDLSSVAKMSHLIDQHSPWQIQTDHQSKYCPFPADHCHRGDIVDPLV